jgi:hypothetical protein
MKKTMLCFIGALTVLSSAALSAPRYFVIANHPRNGQGRLLEYGNTNYASCVAPVYDTNLVFLGRMVYRSANTNRYPEAGGTNGVQRGSYTISFKDIVTTIVDVEPFTTHNRDYMKPDITIWNWSVREVTQITSGLLFPGGNIPYYSGTIQSVGTNLGRIADAYNGKIMWSQDFLLAGELPLQPVSFLPNGWKKTWLGLFYDGYYPWVYSQTYGWLYLIPGTFDPFDIWMYRHGHGWVWTAEDEYPRAYDAVSGQWIDFRSLALP